MLGISIPNPCNGLILVLINTTRYSVVRGLFSLFILILFLFDIIKIYIFLINSPFLHFQFYVLIKSRKYHTCSGIGHTPGWTRSSSEGCGGSLRWWPWWRERRYFGWNLGRLVLNSQCNTCLNTCILCSWLRSGLKLGWLQEGYPYLKKILSFLWILLSKIGHSHFQLIISFY
jgi:hypothetical protein